MHMPHTIKGAILSFFGAAFVVLFVVMAFAGPKAASQIAGAGGYLTGGSLGALAYGVTEIPHGYNASKTALGNQSYVSNYPALQPQAKAPLTPAQKVAKAKRDLAKAKQDLAKAKASQP